MVTEETSKVVSLAEVKNILKKIEKDRKELIYEQRIALEHAQKFAKLSVKQTKDLIKDLINLGNIEEHHAYKIADILPISELVKTEVRGLAGYLDVPEDIISRPPSAGLWEGQTDEGELGMTYEEIDKIILSGELTGIVKEHYEATRHKRELPPVCSLN